jgi:hypothetical protein
MATSGDGNQLKGLKSWEIGRKPAVAQPNAEGTFDLLFDVIPKS